jgi:hypothetical protein
MNIAGVIGVTFRREASHSRMCPGFENLAVTTDRVTYVTGARVIEGRRIDLQVRDESIATHQN